MSNRNGLLNPGPLLALNQSETNFNLKIEPDSLVIKVPSPPLPPPPIVLAELDKLNESRHGFKGFELSRHYKQVSVN